MVTDNGLQFIDQKLNEFLGSLGSKHRVTSVEHLQTNKQAETSNKIILGEQRKRLDRVNGRWAEELAKVL